MGLDCTSVNYMTVFMELWLQMLDVKMIFIVETL